MSAKEADTAKSSSSPLPVPTVLLVKSPTVLDLDVAMRLVQELAPESAAYFGNSFQVGCPVKLFASLEAQRKYKKPKRKKLFSPLAVSKNKRNEAYLSENRLNQAKKLRKVCMIFY